MTDALWRRREPEPSKGPIPFHLLKSLKRSFSEDHFVSDTGDVVYYQQDPNFWQKVNIYCSCCLRIGRACLNI